MTPRTTWRDWLASPLTVGLLLLILGAAAAYLFMPGWLPLPDTLKPGKSSSPRNPTEFTNTDGGGTGTGTTNNAGGSTGDTPAKPPVKHGGNGTNTTEPPRRNPGKPAEHWSNNPKYQETPPRFDVPEERKDAVERMTDLTQEIIANRNLEQLEQAMDIWKTPSYKLAPELADIVLSSQAEPMRAFALKLLGDLKIEDNRGLYEQLLDDDYWAVRYNAILALAALPGEASKTAIESRLEDENESVRQEAKKQLDLLKGK